LDKGNSAVPKWYPGKLTWNLRIQPWKKKIIFQTIIFRFYVNLRGCIEKKKQVAATLPSDPFLFFVTSIWIVKRSLEKSILGKVQDPLKINKCPPRKGPILKGNEFI